MSDCCLEPQNEGIARITLPPKTDESLLSQISASGSGICTTSTDGIEYRLSNLQIWHRVWYSLKDIIDHGDLGDMWSGTMFCKAGIILRYFSLRAGYITEAERQLAAEVLEMCQVVVLSTPPELHTTLSYLVHKFAIFSTCLCWLRIDEAGNSVCSGNWVVTVRFLFLTSLEDDSTRAWFQHPLDPDLLFTMDLSLVELSRLEFRINFQRQQTDEIPYDWVSSVGVKKKLTSRMRLWQVGDKTILVEPHPRTPDLFQVGLVRSLSNTVKVQSGNRAWKADRTDDGQARDDGQSKQIWQSSEGKEIAETEQTAYRGDRREAGWWGEEEDPNILCSVPQGGYAVWYV